MSNVIKLIQPKLNAIYTYLHNHPEKSWHEVETTNYLYKYLQNEGLSPKRLAKTTGLYVDLGNGEPTVGLRVDIDALWQEVDGEFKANHSCGHDGHMTIGMGVALILKEVRLQGAIRILFQPAEEKGEGALSVLDEGIMENIRYLFSVHLRPNQELEDGYYSPAIYNGASRAIEGEIRGEDAHAARPHLGDNAIEIGASIVQALKTINHDPMIPATVKMTRFQAGGTSTNVIPGKAIFSIDVRAQKNEVMEQIHQQIERRLQGVALQYGVEINFKTTADLVAAEVNEKAKEILKQAIIQTVGEKYLKADVHSPGGEDFHYYAVKRPTIKATMLGLGCGLLPGLHHPHMAFNEKRLINGVEILTNALTNALQQVKKEEASGYATIGEGKKIRNSG